MAVQSSLAVAALIVAACIGSPTRAQSLIYADGAPALGGAPNPSVSPLPHNTVVRRWLAAAGESGGGIAGVSTDEGVDECVEPCELVYENTLGRSVFGPYSAVGRWMADDIVTTAVAGCNLDHYVVKVFGDHSGNGPDEPFTVDVALFAICPGASSEPVPLPNTECHFSLPDNGVYELSCEVPSELTVPLPQSMYVGVSFNRANAGVVVGAPALRGYSADTFHFPGFNCAGYLGGFPSSPHASFYTKLYTRGACEESHLGYRNSKHSGTHFSPGQAQLFADDISLGVPECRMIAYEVAYSGRGFLQVDLREFLSNSDPNNGGLISLDTRRNFFSFEPSVKVARAEFAEPIDLPRNFFVTFKTNTTGMGPLRTCKEADVGETDDFYMVVESGWWEAREYDARCWSGFDFTIICEGAAPSGACCDMVFVDSEREPACRDNLPEMNCPFPTLWEEGETCGSRCVGGHNAGNECTRQADCLGGDCPGPFRHPCGLAACCKPDDACEDLTRSECNAVEPVGEPRFFRRGQFCGDDNVSCPFSACLRWEGFCLIGHTGTGCFDPFCCADVCELDPWCCYVEWDAVCVRWSQEFCERPPRNDDCFSSYANRGALLVDANSSTVVGTADARLDETDPGLCCLAEDPGGPGAATVWFRFEATHTTARVHTCDTFPDDGDSVIQVYSLNDPDRGLCTDETVCSLAEQDCADGSICLLDELAACQDFGVIGCSDDEPGCGGGRYSDLCLDDLVPGDTYYVELAAARAGYAGLYKLDIESPCTPGEPGPSNDYCRLAEPISDGVTPFDLAGATFDCPGEDCLLSLRSDVWYDWTASCTGQAGIETCGGSDENTPNTNLVVYEGCDCQRDEASRLGCSFALPSPCFLGSGVYFEAQEGQCYKIRLGGHLDEEPTGNLTITCVPNCPPGVVTFDNPPDGVVDARQPHPPGDPNTRQGIDAIHVTAPTGADRLECWSICESADIGTADAGTRNAITRYSSVVDNGDGTISFTLNLARDITPGAVTAITYTDDDGLAQSGHFTSHPANADGDGASGPPDILAIIDYLNGVRVSPWGIYSEDIDHSGELQPPDILRVIDLLNQGWLNSERPAPDAQCP